MFDPKCHSCMIFIGQNSYLNRMRETCTKSFWLYFTMILSHFFDALGTRLMLGRIMQKITKLLLFTALWWLFCFAGILSKSSTTLLFSGIQRDLRRWDDRTAYSFLWFLQWFGHIRDLLQSSSDTIKIEKHVVFYMYLTLHVSSCWKRWFWLQFPENSPLQIPTENYT